MLAVVKIKGGIVTGVEINGYDRVEEIIGNKDKLLMAALYRAPEHDAAMLLTDLKPELQRAYPEVTELQVIFSL